MNKRMHIKTTEVKPNQDKNLVKIFIWPMHRPNNLLSCCAYHLFVVVFFWISFFLFGFIYLWLFTQHFCYVLLFFFSFQWVFSFCDCKYCFFLLIQLLFRIWIFFLLWSVTLNRSQDKSHSCFKSKNEKNRIDTK